MILFAFICLSTAGEINATSITTNATASKSISVSEIKNNSRTDIENIKNTSNNENKSRIKFKHINKSNKNINNTAPAEIINEHNKLKTSTTEILSKMGYSIVDSSERGSGRTHKSRRRQPINENKHPQTKHISKSKEIKYPEDSQQTLNQNDKNDITLKKDITENTQLNATDTSEIPNKNSTTVMTTPNTTVEPTKLPTQTQTPMATYSQTPRPSASPPQKVTPTSTVTQTPAPTATLMQAPTKSATPTKTQSPKRTPTDTPKATAAPTASQTFKPSIEPTTSQTISPTTSVSPSPTPSPSLAPTNAPTSSPSLSPTPTSAPTASQSLSPTPTSIPPQTPAATPSPSPSPPPTMTVQEVSASAAGRGGKFGKEKKEEWIELPDDGDEDIIIGRKRTPRKEVERDLSLEDMLLPDDEATPSPSPFPPPSPSEVPSPSPSQSPTPTCSPRPTPSKSPIPLEAPQSAAREQRRQKEFEKDENGFDVIPGLYDEEAPAQKTPKPQRRKAPTEEPLDFVDPFAGDQREPKRRREEPKRRREEPIDPFELEDAPAAEAPPFGGNEDPLEPDNPPGAADRRQRRHRNKRRAPIEYVEEEEQQEVHNVNQPKRHNSHRHGKNQDREEEISFDNENKNAKKRRTRRQPIPKEEDQQWNDELEFNEDDDIGRMKPEKPVDVEDDEENDLVPKIDQQRPRLLKKSGGDIVPDKKPLQPVCQRGYTGGRCSECADGFVRYEGQCLLGTPRIKKVDAPFAMFLTKGVANITYESEVPPQNAYCRFGGTMIVPARILSGGLACGLPVFVPRIGAPLSISFDERHWSDAVHVSTGIDWLPYAAIGAVLFVLILIIALRPRSKRRQRGHSPEAFLPIRASEVDKETPLNIGTDVLFEPAQEEEPAEA